MKSSGGIKLVILAAILLVIFCGAGIKLQATQQKTAWEYKIVSHTSLAGIKSMEDAGKRPLAKTELFLSKAPRN